MSVIELDKEHISVIVWAAINNSPEPIEFQGHTPDQLGELLTNLNHEALDQTYGQRDALNGEYTYTPPQFDSWQLGEILKALECYLTQISGLPDPQRSKATQLIEAIRQRVIHHAAPETYHITRLTIPQKEINYERK